MGEIVEWFPAIAENLSLTTHMENRETDESIM